MNPRIVFAAVALLIMSSLCDGSDNCPATVISSLPYVDGYVNLCVAQNNFDNSGLCDFNSREVIYSFIPPSTGFYNIYVGNLTLPYHLIDLNIAVRSSGACPGTTWLGCTESTVFREQNFPLVVEFTAGVNYFLVIEGVDTSCGTLAFVLTHNYVAGCPTDFTHECLGEFVGDSLNDKFDCNGGCPSWGGVADFGVQNISIGDSVCAQSFNYPGVGGDSALDVDYFAFTLNTSRQIILSINSEFAASIFLFNNLECNPGINFGMYSQANIPHSELTTCMGATTYYVQIKPLNQNGFGDLWDQEVLNYTFRVDTIACAACTIPTTFTAPRYVQYQNTCGFGNDCAYMPSVDRFYQIYFPYASRWTISLCDTSPSWDSKIFLSTGCCAGTIIAQNDNGCGELGGLSSIECVDLEAGVYYLTVEGIGGVCGVYNLNIVECHAVTINEIMYDDTASGNFDVEWIELHNATNVALSIGDWVITDGPTWPPPNTEGALQIPTGTVLPAYGYIVLSTVALPGIASTICPEVDAIWALNNGGDNLALYDGIGAGAKLIDGSLTVVHPDLAPSNTGVSVEKCPENIPWSGNSADWAASTTQFSDTGRYRFCTPGASNSCVASTTCLPPDSLTLRLTCCENQFELRYYTPGVPVFRIYYSTDLNAVFPVTFSPLVIGTNVPAGSYSTNFGAGSESMQFVGVSDCTPVAASSEQEIIVFDPVVR